MEEKTANLVQNLETEKVKQLRLRDPVFVTKDTALFAAFEMMRTAKMGCALIRENNELIGIFTERDLIHRVIGGKRSPTTPISEVMTQNPQTLPIDSTIAQAIRSMDEGAYRNIPLTETKNTGKTEVVKILCIRDLVRYFGTYFAREVYNLPPDPEQLPQEREGA